MHCCEICNCKSGYRSHPDSILQNGVEATGKLAILNSHLAQKHISTTTHSPKFHPYRHSTSGLSYSPMENSPDISNNTHPPMSQLSSSSHPDEMHSEESRPVHSEIGSSQRDDDAPDASDLSSNGDDGSIVENSPPKRPTNSHPASSHISQKSLDPTPAPTLPLSPLSVWVRVLIASVLMAFCSGISWSYPSLKNNFLKMGAFGHWCPQGSYPCEDQQLILNIMFQVTVSGSQILSIFSGLFFQIFKRKLYIFCTGLVFFFGVSGFGVALLLKDVPWLSDVLLMVCYFSIGFSGLSILMGFLSFQRDVPMKRRSIVAMLVNAPFDLSTSIFFFFSLLNDHARIPLWTMFVVYGIAFGIILCTFSLFIEPKHKKHPATLKPDNDVEQKMEPNEPIDKLKEESTQEQDTEMLSLVPPISVEDSTTSSPTKPARIFPSHHEAPLTPEEEHSATNFSAVLSRMSSHSRTASVESVEQEDDLNDIELKTSHTEVHLSSEKSQLQGDSIWSRLKVFGSKVNPSKVIPFRMYLQPEVIIFHIVDTLLVSKLNFYSSTVLEQLTWILDSEDRALELVTVFNILQPFIGTIISILVGPFLSRGHPTIGVVIVFSVCFLWCVFELIPVQGVQYATFFFFFCSRALYFIVVAFLVYSCFEEKHAPIIYSSILTFSGLFGVGLSFLANYIAIKVFAGNFLIVNILYGGSTCFFLILYFISVIRLHRKSTRRNNKQRESESAAVIIEAKEEAGQQKVELK